MPTYELRKVETVCNDSKKAAASSYMIVHITARKKSFQHRTSLYLSHN